MLAALNPDQGTPSDNEINPYTLEAATDSYVSSAGQEMYDLISAFIRGNAMWYVDGRSITQWQEAAQTVDNCPLKNGDVLAALDELDQIGVVSIQTVDGVKCVIIDNKEFGVLEGWYRNDDQMDDV